MRESDWDERYRGSELLWSAEPNQFVEHELGELDAAGRTALDLACGEGRNAVWLAERGWTTLGLDFSPVALERAADLAHARGVTVEWRHADVTTWRAPGQGFGLVLIAYLHLPPTELAPVIEQAAAAVAPGGAFLAVGHHADNLQRGHGGPSDPQLLWDPARIAAMLDGLTIERAEERTRTVTTDEGPRTALDALVRAHRPA